MDQDGAGPERRGGGGAGAASALSAATLAFGSSALIIAGVLVVLHSLESPGRDVWAALLCLVPMAVLTGVTRVRPRAVWTVLHLVLGVVGIGVYTAVVIADAPGASVESPSILALPQIALVYTIAPTIVGLRSIVLIAAASVLGQAAVVAAGAWAGRSPVFDWLTAVSAVVLLTVAVSVLVIARRSAPDRRAVERARRDAAAIGYQQELESQVVALFHDTVLSELTVLAQQTPGPLGDTQRAAIARSLTLIADGAWWPEHTEPGRGEPVEDALPPLMAEVVDSSRSGGLAVDVLGDLASLHRLSPAVGTAVALALRQALVNVAVHSGVDRAEIVVDGAPDAVVVMITDAGRGFIESDVPSDRLGVSQSIRGRIHDVGGQTQLWTSPGTGTAYMFTLPVPPERSWPDPESREAL